MRAVSHSVPAVETRSVPRNPLVANPVNTVATAETVVVVRPARKAKSLVRSNRTLGDYIGCDVL